jgi:hypothetical protein
MRLIKLKKGERVEILPFKEGRKSITIRVLSFGACVCLHLDNQDMGIPGNRGLYQTESINPWLKAVEATADEDAEIEVLEDIE